MAGNALFPLERDPSTDISPALSVAPAVCIHTLQTRQGQRAHLVGLLIGKEHPLFAPGKALGQQGKGVATEWMKGMGDGKAMLTIRVIRCS